MVIRKAKIEDAAAIATIHVTTWQAAYQGIIPQQHLDGLTASIDKTIRFWERTISEINSCVFVVENSDGQMLGWASGGRARDDADDVKDSTEVYALYVAHHHWNQGVGRLLLTSMEAELPRLPKTYLWVLKDNARAIRFYQSMGYQQDGVTKVVLIGGTPVKEIRMIKFHALSPAD